MLLFFPFQDQSPACPGSTAGVFLVPMELQSKGNDDQGDMENSSGWETQTSESKQKERSELPQVFSDGQPEDQNVGSGTRHGRLDITSGLYGSFSIMEIFLF